MKICLYLEFYHFLGGFLYKNIGTGVVSSYENQKKALQTLGIEFTEKWDDSCDIIQLNSPWPLALWLMKKARRQGKKIIIWAHNTAEDTRNVFWFNNYFFPIIKKYLAYTFRQADIVFCPSEYTKSLLKAYGLPEEKLIVRSNGVDLKKFYGDLEKRKIGREKFNLNALTIGTVAQVIPRKGTATFLSLAKEFPDNQFIWVGNFFNKLMANPLPKTLPTNVKFTGFVDDVCAAFNAMDIFVFLSYEENQGMVILEAAAVGLPILVRDIPTYQGWLKHEENCLKAKTTEEFKICIQRLISDRALKDKLITNGHILAQENSIETQNKKLLEIYQKLLEK